MTPLNQVVEREADMRPSRRRGLTLIEVLVAATLGTIIIGVVVSISIQVQRSIGIAQLRTLTTRQVYSFFTDLEHDLARIVPNVPTPSAAGDPGQRPLIIERGTTAVTGNPDPAGLVRIVDRIQMWVTNPDATNGAATVPRAGRG